MPKKTPADAIPQTSENTEKTKVTTDETDTPESVPAATSAFMVRTKALIQKMGVRNISIVLSLLVLAVGGYFGFRYWNFVNLAPTAIAGNFSMEYRKIPYNVPSIDITFSHDIDPASVNANSVRMYPFVAGTPTLKNSRTVSYVLTNHLDIGKKYLFDLTTDIKSARGTPLSNEISYDFEAIGGVTVSKMIPEGDTTALSKNPLFIFNIPVVPLGSLESRDQLPCPVKFTPELPGRCTWPSGNILEYRIDRPLDAATQYQVHIELGSEFLFPLEKPFDGMFNTTRLQVLTGATDESGIQNFSPKTGIPLNFSAPVELEALSRAIVLNMYGKGEVVPHRVIPAIPGEAVSTNFYVTGESGPLPFSTNFALSIPVGLMPKPGNVGMKDPVTISLRSNSFVSQVYFMRTAWSATGAVEHISTGMFDGFIPPDRPFVSITLDEPVNLASLGKNAIGAVVLRDAKAKRDYACTLTQPETSVPEFPDSLKMVMRPDERRLDCQISEKLPYGTEFELVFGTALTASLREPFVMPFSTSKEFVIHDVVLRKATELCIYASAPIDYAGSGVTISPQARIRDITYNYYRTDGSNERVCEERAGQATSIGEVRLDGGTKYDFQFTSELRDAYGSPLAKNFEKKGLVAPALQPGDQYLYFMPEKSELVIPMDAPIVLPLQTINLDEIRVQVCSMSPVEYEKHLNYPYREGGPICEATFEKKIPVKNGKWNLTTQQIDLSEDVIGGPLPGNILLVRGTSDDRWTHDYPLQHSFQVVYRRSNLSLMMETGANKGIIFATDFDGKKIPTDLQFEAFDSFASNCNAGFAKLIRFNAEKQYYEWNAEKYTSNCRVVVAKNAEYYGVVTTSTDATSSYDFGQYGGADTGSREYAYLHTDRPIYRAGDTVHFQGILRNFAATGYVKSKDREVKIRILNNQSELFKEVVLRIDGNSNFDGSFDLVTGMPTGRYFFEVLTYSDNSKSGQGTYVVNDGNFYVEQYSKPAFKTEVSGGNRHLFEGDSIDSTATATYYFGGRVSNAPIQWKVTSQKYYFDPKNFSEYRFGTDSSFMECRYWGVCSNYDRYLGNFEKTLDALGTSQLKYTASLFEVESESGTKIVGTPDAKQEELVTFAAEVRDPNTGKTVTGTNSHIVHVTDGYVGINSPYWTEKGAKIPVKGVTLDVDSQVRSAKVKLELIQLQWNSVKKLGVDGIYYNDYEMQKTLEATESVTSSKDGKFQTELAPKAGGEYVIRASYTGKNGQAYVSDSYSYVATEKYSLWNTGNNSVTELTAEKTMVQPGETAVFTLKSPVASGKIIYSVEKDDVILDAKVVDITGYGQKIEIPVQAIHIPNVYVRAYLIGRDDAKGLPVYKRALSQLRVLPDSKKLEVGVTAERAKYLPGETLKVTVAVKDSTGKPVPNAAGTLSVVDESVLALLGNPEKNPFAFFYDMKRYLGTSVSVSLLNLVEKLEIKNAGNGEKGGAGEGNKGGDTKKKRGIFKDTAFWTGKFTTDANGNAVIDTGKLPDNLTTWKIEAVIATDTTQIGAGRTSITTEQKVMIQENFPRFLRTGDRTDFAPVIFNRTGKRQRFTVEMQAKGAQVTPSKLEIALDDGASIPALFEVKGMLEGSANSAPVELSVTATAESGESDGIQKSLVLHRGETYETTAFIGTAEGAGIGEVLDLTGVREGGILTLTTAPSLLGNVLTGLDNLLVYPYGCLEQITSRIVPHIAVKNIHDALGVPYDLKTVMVKEYDGISQVWIERNIHDVMSGYAVKLMGYRLNGGGFGYWNSGMQYADFRLTAYAANVLADIKALGVPVDVSMSEGAVKNYLKTRLQSGVREGCSGPEKDCRYSIGEKLMAVMAITRWSTDGLDGLKAYKALGDTNTTLTNRIDTLQLIAELVAHSGISEVEKSALRKSATESIDVILKSNLVYDPRGAYIAPDDSSSRTEMTAKFIRAVAYLGEDSGPNRQMLDNASRFLVRAKKADGSYGSTLETATVLRAFAARTIRDTELTKANFESRATIGGKEVYSKRYDRQNLLDSSVTQISMSELGDRETLNITTNGVGRLYYDLSLKYPVAANEVAARDEGFFVQTTMYDYLDYQKIENDKTAEFEKYSQGKLRYSELKYPKEVREYAKPIVAAKVWQLARVEYRVITSEARDQVAFEAFIPAGSELVNTRLATETKAVTSDTFFEREDLMDDRYFAYRQELPAGEYTGSYALRFTHAGSYMVPATRISEFYTPEVFGQTTGGLVEVK